MIKAGKQRERTIKAKWRDRTTKPKQHDPALRAKQRDRAIKAKQLFLSVIQPSLPILVVAPFAIATMMIWVFLFDNQAHPVAYAFYALSFYLFVVVCVGVFSKKNVQRVKELANKNKIVRRILNEDDYRLRTSIVLGIGADALWALVNFALGVILISAWFVTLGFYYLLFGSIRALLLFQMLRTKEESHENQRQTRKMLRACGVIMIASTFVFSGIVTLLLHGDATIQYGEIITIALATFTFYSLISALVGFIRLRNHSNQLVGANCRANLCIALVSLFTLEMAMLTTFGTGDTVLPFIMPIITGSVVAVILCWMGIVTVKRAK